LQISYRFVDDFPQYIFVLCISELCERVKERHHGSRGTLNEQTGAGKRFLFADAKCNKRCNLCQKPVNGLDYVVVNAARFTNKH